MEIHPTWACNHMCVWCYESKILKYLPLRAVENINHFIRRYPSKSLPEYLFRDVITACSDGGIKSIQLAGGGEPTIHPFFKNAVDLANKKGLKVGVITNGSGLTCEDIRNSLLECNGFVRVSLDASNEAIHNSVHAKRGFVIHLDFRFDKILDGLRLLLLKRKDKRKLKIGASFVVHFDDPSNNSCIENFVRLMKDSGADYAQIKTEYIRGQNISVDVAKALNDDLEKYNEKYNDTNFSVIFKGRAVPDLDLKYRKQVTEKGYKKCFAHYLLPLVGANSEAYICCQLLDVPKGSDNYQNCSFGSPLEGQSLIEFWRSAPRKELEKQIDVEKCGPCRFDRMNKIIDFLSRNKEERDIIDDILSGKVDQQLEDRYSKIMCSVEDRWTWEGIISYFNSLKILGDDISPYFI
jgi:MoaA/NifB/PqqE/SkfB family radical SAM enzyme